MLCAEFSELILQAFSAILKLTAHVIMFLGDRKEPRNLISPMLRLLVVLLLLMMLMLSTLRERHCHSGGSLRSNLASRGASGTRGCDAGAGPAHRRAHAPSRVIANKSTTYAALAP
jgi:hypothetical protein